MCSELANNASAEAVPKPAVEHTIYPQGDIVLTTSDNHRFLVHSIFLRNSSRVWDAMLSGRFAEGIKLSSDNPKEISAEEDDTEALHKVLLLVHMNYKNLAKSVSVKALYNIAVVVDKYGCADALSLPLQAWFAPYIGPTAGDIGFFDLGYLVAASAAMDQTVPFADFTRRLAFDHSRPMLDLLTTDMALISESVLLQLERQRQRVRVLIRYALNGLMKAIAATSTCRYCHRDTISPVYWRRLTGALSSLADFALAPVLEELLDNVYLQGAHGETCQCPPKQKAPSLPESAQEDCMEYLVQARDQLRGLCLDCVRSGSFSCASNEHHVH